MKLSELFENTAPSTVIINGSISSSRNDLELTNQEFNDFKTFCDTTFHSNSFELTEDGGSFDFSITWPLNNLKAARLKVFKVLENYLVQTLKLKCSITSYIEFDYLPNQTIDCNSIDEIRVSIDNDKLNKNTNTKFINDILAVHLVITNPADPFNGLEKFCKDNKVNLYIETKHIIGLVSLIKLDLAWLSFNNTVPIKVQQILLNHLQQGQDMLECKEELINNGFKEYAKIK